MDYRVVSPLLSFQQSTSLHSVTYPLWTERLTNSTNHSRPWDGNRRPGGKEFTRLLWNPEVHCCIYNSPLVFPFTNLVSSVHGLRLCVFKIYFVVYHLILAYVLQVDRLHCFLKIFLNIYLYTMLGICTTHLTCSEHSDNIRRRFENYNAHRYKFFYSRLHLDWF
jgi:hypothetical protein